MLVFHVSKRSNKGISVKTPIKLARDLVLFAALEVRFATKIPPDAVFGIVYQSIVERFPQSRVVRLPILQMPDAIRNVDPNLVFQPHHQLDIDSRQIWIGPRVISFVAQKPYIGWQQWQGFIADLLSVCSSFDLFELVERVGLRYLNFSEENLCLVADVDMRVGADTLSCQPMTFRTEIPEDGYVKILNLANNAVVEVSNQRNTGSIIDIEVVKLARMAGQSFMNDFEVMLGDMHSIGKKMFFDLLQNDFLDTLGPEYEEVM